MVVVHDVVFEWHNRDALLLMQYFIHRIYFVFHNESSVMHTHMHIYDRYILSTLKQSIYYRNHIMTTVSKYLHNVMILINSSRFFLDAFDCTHSTHACTAMCTLIHINEARYTCLFNEETRKKDTQKMRMVFFEISSFFIIVCRIV